MRVIRALGGWVLVNHFMGSFNMGSSTSEKLVTVPIKHLTSAEAEVKIEKSRGAWQGFLF